MPFATKTSCFARFFRENKKLNLELESASFKIATLRSLYEDMSAKPCDNCAMIMVNYVDIWLILSYVASFLDGARLELRELKARSTLLGACTTCPLLRSDLEALTIEIKYLKHKLDHSSRYTILSPPCEACASLKGKLCHATKENTELQQEVAYLTARLEKIILSEKMIEDDLSRVKVSASKSTYKLGIGFERCEDKDTLFMVHVLIVVIISCVGLVFLQKGFTLVLSQDTWTVHVFPIVVFIPLVQMVKSKRL
jgi:hypothetical protein